MANLVGKSLALFNIAGAQKTFVLQIIICTYCAVIEATNLKQFLLL